MTRALLILASLHENLTLLSVCIIGKNNPKLALWEARKFGQGKERKGRDPGGAAGGGVGRSF